VVGRVVDGSGSGIEADIEAAYDGCTTTYQARSDSDGQFTVVIPVRDTFSPAYIPVRFTANDTDEPTTRLV
jgi:hypothetical protein